MPREKRRRPRPPKVHAKLEAVAKATFQRKKITTEVIPPDVTRAKAGRWLDFISPITEWAGLKGDALSYQRRQLRIQQEAALEAVAQSVRKRMIGKVVKRRLPAKLFVPVLEAASLEDAKSPLTEWWAQLLVSGATEMSVRPYMADLMKSIGADEATVLERMWRQALEVFEGVRLKLYDGEGLEECLSTTPPASFIDHWPGIRERALKVARRESKTMGALSAFTAAAAILSNRMGFPVTVFAKYEPENMIHAHSSSNLLRSSRTATGKDEDLISLEIALLLIFSRCGDWTSTFRWGRTTLQLGHFHGNLQG